MLPQGHFFYDAVRHIATMLFYQLRTFHLPEPILNDNHPRSSPTPDRQAVTRLLTVLGTALGEAFNPEG